MGIEGLFKKKKNGGEELRSDREFHEARYERMAKKYNSHWLTKWGIRELTDAEEMAHEEGRKYDNPDFDLKYELNEEGQRAYTKEYERYNKKLEIVKQALIDKRDLPSEETQDTQVAIFAMGGGNLCARSAGQLVALQQMGLTKNVDVFMGASGGSGPAAYAAAGKAEDAAWQYEKACTRKEFFEISAFPPRIKIDLEVPGKSMRQGPHALDAEAVRASNADVYAVVVNSKSYETELLDLKTVKTEMVQSLQASAAVPALIKPVEVDGATYIDGAVNPLPLGKIAELGKKGTNGKITHLLLLPNTPFDYLSTIKYDRGERTLMWMAGSLGSLGSLDNPMKFAEMLLKKKEEARELFEQIERETGLHIAVLWPPKTNLGSKDIDQDRVTTAVMESARATFKEFGVEGPRDLGTSSDTYEEAVAQKGDHEKLKNAA